MELRLALIGFGGVNQGLFELLLSKKDELRKYGIDTKITAVTDLRLGTVTNPSGISTDALRASIQAGLSAIPLQADPGTSVTPDSDLDATLKLIASDFVDVVVEATFTDPQTGEPALSHCRTALESSKHVITTNKGPIALAQQELVSIANRNGVFLKYEGTVMSGTPVLRQISTTLRGCEVTGFSGILNGTSNFVLGEVAAGKTFDSAIQEAQVLGYAEANPAADLEGSDVQLKVMIMANALWGAGLCRDDVPCRGITGLTESEIRRAITEGGAWRLVGSARRSSDGTIVASVEPKELPAGHPLLAATGVTNAISFDTDVLGLVTVTGPGAGRVETAFAILSDLIDIGEKVIAGATEAAA
jgi:homoserine dehydrogenase